jgi:hypothetical protein
MSDWIAEHRFELAMMASFLIIAVLVLSVMALAPPTPRSRDD